MPRNLLTRFDRMRGNLETMVLAAAVLFYFLMIAFVALVWVIGRAL